MHVSWSFYDVCFLPSQAKLIYTVNLGCQYNVMQFKAIHSIKKNVIKIKTCPLTFIPLIQPIHA